MLLMVSWLLRLSQEEEEEENMGDVDLFTLTRDGSALTVNGKWLQHLQERLLGEDGHPRKVHDGDDPHRMGLVLEWVYGSIVSTAEKARDGAKRQLGLRSAPTGQIAYETLMRALEDQAQWESRARQAKDLLNQMLKSRKEAAELGKQHDIRPVPRNSAGDVVVMDDNTLPDEVIVAMLTREALLTQAKLHALVFEHVMHDKQLRSTKAQIRQVCVVCCLARPARAEDSWICNFAANVPCQHLRIQSYAELQRLLYCLHLAHHQAESLPSNRGPNLYQTAAVCLTGMQEHNIVFHSHHQGEPELERLKRELEEIKHAPRGLEGTFRTAAEMERHRHQLADAAIEEQLEVQTAFREQGTKLQGLYDKKQRTEYEMAKK